MACRGEDNMKAAWYMVLLIILMIMTGCSTSEEQESGTNDNSQFTIYYGLNGSGSRSWTQINRNGVVGISYFQRIENRSDQGDLIYETIHPNGSSGRETVTHGSRLEKSVLLFDPQSNPHIFVARSDDTDQVIDHHTKNNEGQWHSETIVNFLNEGGRFIYELSADTGPGGTYHLVVLKTSSDIDSGDFMDAWVDAHLYHLTNASGQWRKELVHNYDMVYTYDMYVKTLTRQDIKVDRQGFIHVVFGEQINGQDYDNSPSRLFYATNKTGNWIIETAFTSQGTRDDAGWHPSLCLDSSGTPFISCMYVARVPTGSASYCKLFLLNRMGENNWRTEIIAEQDDGYYGGDGRNYTGALSHLVFDNNNTPHVVFSDVASSHWGSNYLNLGNIRYGVKEGGIWRLQTIYRQPLPTAFHEATEMGGMCLLISEITGAVRVVGQELVITGDNQYTCGLVNIAWAGGNQ